MGRDNKQGKSANKGSLPQTPKTKKIAPNKASEKANEEFSQEFTDLINSVTKEGKTKK
ncbi:hypothetical protein FJQ98_21390 [Lysinibacillus agricola]|uniref:YfhD family protein n=1 Tax=Lysinibacillus agricola TaxID=2590012 RepID=A0ABX7AQ47_9BACI|nr:hypothetical protein [Lysinibacillus agricola]QQP11711.1 hypothetical protein FJQ98_21390 [Lysinibacillus agricola]